MGMPGVLRTIARAANRHDPRPSGFRERPERVVLEAQDGVASKPPVRIFVGTEPRQQRAERVFIWSIEQARDPARVYEIYLMADLAGFDRRRWLTGFTNYRFAIPHFAGGQGRAIYNDVDQIYLADPAELFDMDMGDHGFLSITERDTSVMLIDCARMAGVWKLDLAQRQRRKRIEAGARTWWGPLPREWNARDEEYTRGRSRVLHYTTIHAQPWQPFSDRFVYQRNPVGHVWLEMERAADLAQYQVFTARHPSGEYQRLITTLRESRGNRLLLLPRAAAVEGIEELLAEAHAASVLDYQLGVRMRSEPCVAERAGRTVTRFDVASSAAPAAPEKGFDAVVCCSDIEYVPDADVPWIIESLFACARRCLYLRVSSDPQPVRLNDGTRLGGRAHEQSWWVAHLEAASARHPEVHWKLVLQRHRGAGRRAVTVVREGGRRVNGRLPTVWVLKDHKPGHTTQSIGLAEALGFPYETKELHFNLFNHLSNRVRGATTLGLNKARSAALHPPWPDLVISTGRRTAPVARWIGRQSQGRTRLVQLGRRGGETVEAFDLVVACAHFRLPLHPRRMEIVAPLNAVTPERLAQAAARWRGLFDGAPHPHVVLVVGGTSARHRLDPEIARRLGADACAFAASLGGSVFAITSRRTGTGAAAALRAGLGDAARLHEWKPDERDNPYLAHLALADAIIVTGESESMLAEAAAAGKPLFIYPVPERLRRVRWPAEWVARRAEARPRKAKGTVRPQQGLEYLCARLIEAGIVRPPRDLRQLHEGLIRDGGAQYFGAALNGGPRRRVREVDAVARRVRLLLGFADPPAAPRAVPRQAAI
jgi:mitochondrial fission protein ELM1